MDVLFHSLDYIELPQDASVAVLNARHHERLRDFSHLTLQQDFKPYADELLTAGFVLSELGEIAAQDVVFLNVPKTVVEAKYLIACGLRIVRDGGVFVCAAANDANGTRLAKWLKEFGLRDVQSLSKDKARVCWGVVDGFDNHVVDEAYEAGLPQRLDTGFVSQAGIYGWDKIDQGSEILAQHLPKLSGRGADFGCGYGYLVRTVLQHKNVSELICIDADKRALECCMRNCEDDRVSMRWEDLTKRVDGLNDLDFIVMNPPFHEGKAADSNIGKAFVVRVAASLKQGGVLYMVANVHLPYEDVLQDKFSRVEKMHEGGGFKVFSAVK